MQDRMERILNQKPGRAESDRLQSGKKRTKACRAFSRIYKYDAANERKTMPARAATFDGSPVEVWDGVGTSLGRLTGVEGGCNGIDRSDRDQACAKLTNEASREWASFCIRARFLLRKTKFRDDTVAPVGKFRKMTPINAPFADLHLEKSRGVGHLPHTTSATMALPE
jgi:hypothetical protein